MSRRSPPDVSRSGRQPEGGAGVSYRPIRPREDRDRWPLSAGQRRLWFLDQLEGGHAAYVLPAAVRLQGALDLPALARSLREVVRRHEVLRAVVYERRGEPHQRVEPRWQVPVPVVDLGGVDRRGRPGLARDLARLEAARPFDLATGPLLRIRLLRLDAADHVLFFAIHHIVTDGISTSILIREVGALYQAFHAGEASPLPELPIQFADFAAWQNDRTTEERLAADLAFWREQLAGAPASLDLPLDRPRRRQVDPRGRRVRREPRPDLARRLAEWSREQGVTLYLTALAVFLELLARWSGARDLVVGTPVAGRLRPETRSLIGFFVNTLVVRADLDGAATMADLVARVRTRAHAAFAHQETPFDRLVEELAPERGLGLNPLFQVVFALEGQVGTDLSRLRLGDLDAEIVDVDRGAATFDLVFTLKGTRGGLATVVEYRSDLFDATTAARLARSFEALADAALARPDLPPAELPALTPAEAHQLRVEWNDGPDPDLEGDLLHRLARRAAGSEDAVALVAGDRHLSYRHLLERVDRAAARLRALGVGPETTVGVHLERSPEALLVLLGASAAGGAYVPLDPLLPAERLRWLAEDAAIGLVVTAGPEAPFPGPPGAAVSAGELLARDGDPGSRHAALGPGAPDRLAYVLYTSGSTGRPKGVGVPQRAVARLVQGCFARFGPDETVLQYAPLSFDASTLEIWATLLGGGRLVVAPPGAASLAALAALLGRERITTLWLTAGLFHQMADEEPGALGGLRQLLAGGDVLSPERVVRLVEAAPRLRLVNGYGPTENTTFTCCATLDAAAVAAPSVPIGRPIAGTTVHVVNRQLRPVGLGVAGELVTGGAGLARGYRQRPRATAESFVPDPFSARPGARLYRTGDGARWRPSGRVEFLGRLDAQVKVRGFRIEPAEVEQALLAHPGVRAAAVVAAPQGPGEKRLVAVWVAEDGAAPTEAELAAFLRQTLPSYMVPSVWLLRASLPLNPNGKVDRRALAALPVAPEPRVAGADDAPRTPTEEILAGLFAAVLGLEVVGAGQGFFDLGGHSLLATRLVARIREAFEVDLPLGELFEHPTVRELAERVDARRQGGRTSLPLQPVPRQGPLPLSFAQERLWFLERMHPGPTYNLPGAFEVTGELSAAHLERAVAEVAHRHETLRSRFPLVDGHPGVVVAERWPGRVSVVDLRSLAAEAQERTLTQGLTAASRVPFDLVGGPVLRVALVWLASGRQVLFLNLHHIVADGLSVDLLLREIAAVYGALSRGGPSGLPALPVQYGDFAVWQRAVLEREGRERSLGYWRRALEGAPPVLELPADRPRPAVPSYAGGTVSFGIASAPRLARLARQAGATHFMGVVAVFQALLHRLAGEADVVVGAPIAQRPARELEDLVGCFINMVPLRAVVDGASGLRALLDQVRAAALGAFVHQDLPFELLVDELAPRRALSYSPIFQVMVALRTEELALPAIGDASLARISLPGHVSRFDLSLVVVEGADGTAGYCEYATDLFDRTTVSRMAAQLVRLLDAAVAEPDRPLDDLPLLARSDWQQVVLEWNEAPGPGAAEPLHRQFQRAVAATPDAVALECEGDALSFACLERRAAALARRLARAGAGPETVVGISLRRTPDLVIAMLAVLEAGAAYLPLDPAYPPERLAFMVRDAGAVAVVTGAADWLPAGVPTVPPAAHGVEADEPAAASSAEAGTLAYVIYTSGSTGRPKGVMVPHACASSFFEAMDRVLERPAAGTWLSVTSVSFDISLLEILWTLSRGLRLVLHGETSFGSAAGGPTRPRSASPRERQVDIGLFYFAAAREGMDDDDSYRLLLDGARFADRHGFSAVWTPERHFHTFGGLYPNPSVTGAAVAAVTERVQVRAGSVVLPLHHPVRVAEEWALVDRLSHGRAGVSFASGWHPNDFVFRPEHYADRKDVMFRDLETVRRLWRGEPITLPGGAGEPVEVRIHPRPIQREIPIWITAGGSPETFQRAGELGANLLTHLLGQSLDDLARKIQVYRDAWNASGHGPERGTVSLMLHTHVGDRLETVRERARAPFLGYLRNATGLMQSFARQAGLALDRLDDEETEALLESAFDRYFERSGLFGTPESCVETLDRLAALDVDEVACLIDFGIPFDATMEGLDGLAEVHRLARRPTPAARPRRSATDEMVRRRATHLQCTPAMAAMLLADTSAASAFDGLARMLVGGEALPPAFASALAAAVGGSTHNMYGPTETTVWSTSAEVVDGGDVTIGRPLVNSRAMVLSPRLRPVPIGVAGQLHLGGSGVARGYLGRPSLTAERFVPDPFGGAGQRLYATGDLVRQRPDGELEFLGRIDHQLKVRGHRIEPAEVERVLRSHPAVREALVTAREVEGDRQLVAYLVATDGGPRKARLSPEEEARLLAGRETFTLPNGMRVVHHDARQAHATYQEVFASDVYSRHGLRFRDGDRILDLGANVGFFTLYACQRCRPAKVVAVEPLPPNAELLRVNAALHATGATVLDCGVADRPGETEFVFYPNASGLSTRGDRHASDLEELEIYVRHHLRSTLRSGADDPLEAQLEAALREHLKESRYRCRLTTISAILAEHDLPHVDLLKLDVEKSEVLALEGIEPEDWPKIRQMVVEVHGSEALERVREILRRQGYQVEVDELMALRGPAGGSLEISMLYGWRPEARAAEPRSAATPAADLSADALRVHLRTELPEFMVPSLFVPLDAFPLLPNGKIDRAALVSASGALRSGAKALVPPRGETESRVAEIWQDLLNVGRVGRDDNFFEVGGTSLLMVQLQQRLQQSFGKDVSLIDLFRHPTVGSLATRLAQTEAADPQGSEQGARRGRRQAEEAGGSDLVQRQRRFLEQRRKERARRG